MYNAWLRFNHGTNAKLPPLVGGPLRMLAGLLGRAPAEIFEASLLSNGGRHALVFDLLSLWRSDDLDAFDAQMLKLRAVGVGYLREWGQTIDLAVQLARDEKMDNLEVLIDILLEERALVISGKGAPGNPTDDDADDVDETSRPEVVAPQQRYLTRPADSDVVLQDIDFQYDPDVFQKYHAFRTYRRGLLAQQAATLRKAAPQD